MSKKSVFLAFLAIIALASFFRLWDIKSIPPGFYPDEAMYANNALEAWETKNFKVFYPENNGREGLWINIMAPVIAIFGNEPWVPRSLAAIIGILTVLGLYFLTKELFKSDRIALLASFFLTTSFWHILFSRIGFRAILAPFFLVWSFYFLWKALGLGRESSVEKLPSTFYILLSGLLFGFGFHTYISYRVAPLLLIIPFVLMWFSGRKNLILIFLIFAFLAALPLGIYFLQNPQDFFGRTSQLSIFSAASPLKDLGLNIVKTIGMFFVRGDYNWRHNLSGSPQLWWPVAILFLMGIIISIKNLRVTRYAFLIIWLITMLIPAVVSNEGIPHALRSIVVVPAVMIFAALGLEWIIVKISDWLRKKSEQYPEKIKQLLRVKKEFVVLLLLFFLAVASESFNQYFFRWAPNPNVADAFSANYVKLGNYLLTLPKNIPKYVIVNANGVDVRGVPMPAQTVMFVTKTFLQEWQKEKNIFYVALANLDSFIETARQKEHLFIAMLENDSQLRLRLQRQIPGLKTDASSGILVLYK